MPVTPADLESFHEFASAKLGSVSSMYELLDMWLLENPSRQEQSDTLAAIREGLSDIEAGRVHDADEVHTEIRQKLDLSDKK